MAKQIEVIDCPETINAGAWLEWVDYRRSRRKPVSERAARMQWGLLERLTPAQQAACIRTSIRNDWQGLFPERYHDNNRPGGSAEADRSAAGRVRAAVERAQAERRAAAAN